jgi:hypothetical protein
VLAIAGVLNFNTRNRGECLLMVLQALRHCAVKPRILGGVERTWNEYRSSESTDN